MNHNPLKIEDLLEPAGSIESREDLSHRYALRRELLCSRHFEDARAASRMPVGRWAAFGAPLLAGGMLVLLVSFTGAPSGEASPIVRQTGDTKVVQATPVIDLPVAVNDFIDLREPTTMPQTVKFVPVQTASHVLLR
ncbi:hypothetical protein HZA85_03165 [Candidatus Uhrbacteria bacterium]|nr:hypothetical protein [Candidatus Uhrbacteria bacterium]